MNGSGPRPVATLWEWQESAACRSADSARFFSPTGERGFARSERERLARELCDVCPVREECARFALAIGEEHGIWGGTTSQERIAQLVGGGVDRRVPSESVEATARRYGKSEAVTSYLEYPEGCHHTVRAPGLETVADDVLDWAELYTHPERLTSADLWQ